MTFRVPERHDQRHYRPVAALTLQFLHVRRGDVAGAAVVPLPLGVQCVQLDSAPRALVPHAVRPGCPVSSLPSSGFSCSLIRHHGLTLQAGTLWLFENTLLAHCSNTPLGNGARALPSSRTPADNALEYHAQRTSFDVSVGLLITVSADVGRTVWQILQRRIWRLVICGKKPAISYRWKKASDQLRQSTTYYNVSFTQTPRHFQASFPESYGPSD